MTYNKARVGVHTTVSGTRNARKLRALRRKYRRYDWSHPTRWWTSLWCAVYIGWMVVKGMVIRG